MTSFYGARDMSTCSCASSAEPPSPDTTMIRASGNAPRTGSTSPAKRRGSLTSCTQARCCQEAVIAQADPDMRAHPGYASISATAAGRTQNGGKADLL